MSNFNALTSMVSAESSDQRRNCTTDLNINGLQPVSARQAHASSDGHVAILWDMENCPVPSDVRPEDVAGNIRMALRVHPIIKGAVMLFSAYGDFNAFPRRLREGCQRTGVKLVDVPNGRKDAADKAILVDMFLFALDNPPPSSIILISGDVDFAPALHILGQRGYTVILVIPTRVDVSSALRNAGKFVWDWPSVARGEGFVPAVKALMPPRAGSADILGYFMGCQISHNPDYANEEEAIVYRGVSQSYYNSRDLSVVLQSLSGQTTSHFPSTSRSQSLPCANEQFPNPPSHGGQQLSDTMWVQPGDINGLKGQLVKLLELSGGCLPLARVPNEYQKLFGKNLYVSEYGVCKLVNLFKNMDDAVGVDGKGNRKFVYLKKLKASTGVAPPFVLLKRGNNKAKRDQEESVDVRAGNGVSSDDLSEEERVVMEESEKRNRAKSDPVVAQINKIGESNLEEFKTELQEILVSYSCRIFLGSFEAVYQQRYKKPLEYRKFGVDKLEELLNKMADVVMLHEDPASKRKFITAVGM